MYDLAYVGVGLFWTLAYILVIKRGFQDKTYGIPLVAVCLNISWEFVFSFIYPAAAAIDRYVNYAWFGFDVIILYQVFKYGPREFRDLSKGSFYWMLGSTLLVCFAIVLSTAQEFPKLGDFYTAYGDNVLMSALFITMLYRRKSLRGQSIWIALFKMLGTTLISLGAFFYDELTRESVLLPVLYVTVFAYDLIYFAMVYKLRRAESNDAIEPGLWKRTLGELPVTASAKSMG